MKRINHSQKLWEMSDKLLERIKVSYGLYSNDGVDDQVLTYIRKTLMDYADSTMESNVGKKKIGTPL